MQRYTGQVGTLRAPGPYGFITRSSIKRKDGGRSALRTKSDVFVHQDDCGGFTLEKGMTVTFELHADDKRGGDAMRAVEVEKVHTGELVLASAGALLDPEKAYVPPTERQRFLMKPVEPRLVQDVLRNRPFERMSREQQAADYVNGVLNRLLQAKFGHFAEYGGVAEVVDGSFDVKLGEVIKTHKLIGMEAQVKNLAAQADTYRALCTLLRDDNDLLKPNAIVPITNLPDLFSAVPVWYFVGHQEDGNWGVDDRLVHFCNLFDNARWMDTFLMFNRRVRLLSDYQGDLMPPKVANRIHRLSRVFDHLVVMTPHHDVAGEEWNDFSWMRNPDPYVVGFLEGIPLMFVVARFCDSGLFPLHAEMVADTIAFLRENVGNLLGFNKPKGFRWYEPHGTTIKNTGSKVDPKLLGDRLVAHTHELLAAFDKGELFDWLRGEEPGSAIA